MLYRQRSSFFYEMRIKPSEKISPFRKRASEPSRTQKTKYAAVSRIPSEAAVGRRVQGSVKRNVFVKPIAPSPVLIESLGTVRLFPATAHRHPYTPAQEPRTEHLRLEISRKPTVSAMHDLHRTTRYRKIPKRIFVFSAKQGFALFRR